MKSSERKLLYDKVYTNYELTEIFMMENIQNN